MPSTTWFHRNRIFSLANARSCMIFDARSWSRRWTIVTDRANLVRKMASSRAESPPPTTAMSSPRKKKPSQVARGHAVAHQLGLVVETQHEDWAPVEMISASAW